MEKSKLKKAIIFDCDNTLWKGIVGEGEIEHKSDIQQDIVFLANHGVIIGLCSKNNEEDVLNALKDQILSTEFLSVWRINWKDKASNMRDIAEELNIGLDSIVFVDDNQYEIRLMNKYLPEVLSIYPEELMDTVNKWFDLSGNYSKTQQYKENLQRARVKETFTYIGDYLRSLEMVLTIKVNDKSSIPRIAELTQKTNQFNLTTNRYSEQQIEFLMGNSAVYSLSVKDKYGDSGLVGVCIVVGYQIDTFLLSCRVIGRDIEYAFIDYVINDQAKEGIPALIGRWDKSEKNGQVKKFYSNIGFEAVNVTENSIIFIQILKNYKPKAPNYFTVHGQ